MTSCSSKAVDKALMKISTKKIKTEVGSFLLETAGVVLLLNIEIEYDYYYNV